MKRPSTEKTEARVPAKIPRREETSKSPSKAAVNKGTKRKVRLRPAPGEGRARVLRVRENKPFQFAAHLLHS